MFLIKKGSPCCFSERGHNNFIYPNKKKSFTCGKDLLVEHISHWIGYDEMRPYIVRDDSTDKKGHVVWTSKLNCMEVANEKR